jgi:hypothetical protein
MTDRELMQQALDAMLTVTDYDALHKAKIALRDRLAHCDRCGKRHGGEGHIHTCTPKQPEQEQVTILPDGSAFGVMSFPLPDDHWLYAPNEYRDGEYEPIDLPKPVLTHALREAVVAAVRYAVRGATMRGQETDFDPDALVQNAVYALCGPYTTPPAAQRWVGLTNKDIIEMWPETSTVGWDDIRLIEAKLKERNT